MKKPNDFKTSAFTMAALIAFQALPLSALSAEKAPDASRPIKGGPVFRVLFREERAKSHQDAHVIWFVTDNAAKTFGLTFVENEVTDFGGMTCTDATESEGALSCKVDIAGNGNKCEKLTVGNTDSDFCTKLRKRYATETDDNKKTPAPDKENPIMMNRECGQYYDSDGKCICYEVVHLKGTDCRPDSPIETASPPGEGSGSGGHN